MAQDSVIDAEAEEIPADKPEDIKDSHPVDPGNLVNDRYSVDFNKRMSQFDSGGVEGFAALDVTDPAHDVVALARKPGIPIRESIVAEYDRRTFRNHLYCRSHGRVQMPGSGEHRYCFIIDNPVGGPIEWDPRNPDVRVPEAKLRQQVIPQLLKALEGIQDRSLTHRRIHPSNIFYLDGARSNVVVGECFSEPPG